MVQAAASGTLTHSEKNAKCASVGLVSEAFDERSENAIEPWHAAKMNEMSRRRDCNVARSSSLRLKSLRPTSSRRKSADSGRGASGCRERMMDDSRGKETRRM